MNQKQTLNILLVISIIVILINNFFFNETPEFISIGHELGQVFSNLSLAYLASYIFYLVVVVTKEKKDKKNVNISVYSLTDSLLDHAYIIYNEIIETTGTPHDKYTKETISKEEYFALLELCDPSYIPKNKHFGTVFEPQYVTVAQFIHNGTIYNTDRYINKIFEFMPFLDTDFVALLNRLRHSYFYRKGADTLLLIVKGNIKDKKIGKFESMYEYLEILREIEAYNEKNHKKYLN